MKISVIIPVYNGEKWVRQCLDNVLAQSYKDLEVIVVDDGSTDRSAEIAAYYPVKLIKLAKNSGLPAARNRGIEVATGEYIHFLDIDDWINLDYYSRMADVAELSGADMVYGGVIHEAYPNLTRLYSERWLVSTIEDKFRLLNPLNQGSVWRYIVNRAFMERHSLRFDEECCIEDMPFTTELLLKANKIVTTPGAIYYYKLRGGSLMRTKSKERKQKLKEGTLVARATCRRLIKEHGVEGVVPPVSYIEKITKYKVLGIPMLEKRFYNNGTVRWYLFGLNVLRSRPLGQLP
jgi:glycosyltransferase involved in cell wall biosynthesis